MDFTKLIVLAITVCMTAVVVAAPARKKNEINPQTRWRPVYPLTQTKEEPVNPLPQTKEEPVNPLTQTKEEPVNPLTQTKEEPINPVKEQLGNAIRPLHERYSTPEHDEHEADQLTKDIEGPAKDDMARPPVSEEEVPAISKRIGVVAFSAYRTSDFAASPIDETIVEYEFTKTNEGGAFDGQIFTAPVSGIYYFSFQGCGKSLYMSLYVNGVMQVSFFTRQSDDNQSSSRSIVLNVIQGEDVHTTIEAGDRLSDNARALTGFSGFLLHESI